MDPLPQPPPPIGGGGFRLRLRRSRPLPAGRALPAQSEHAAPLRAREAGGAENIVSCLDASHSTKELVAAAPEAGRGRESVGRRVGPEAARRDEHAAAVTAL